MTEKKKNTPNKLQLVEVFNRFIKRKEPLTNSLFGKKKMLDQLNLSKFGQAAHLIVGVI